jgi:cation transport ATPase
MSATSLSPALRVEPGANSVRIWSEQIFGAAEVATLREFLARAFSVDEVETVELQRADAFGRLRYRARSSPAAIWKKLSRALRGGSTNGSATKPAPVASVYLDAAQSGRVQVTRIGSALTTWHVRKHSESQLRLFHPLLRGNRDMQFRLEEELAATFGVQSFQASALGGTLSIQFDATQLTASRLALQLEKAWPRLLAGLTAPPPPRRLAIASGVLGLAFTGQFLVPAVRPIAVLGAALYSSPNAVAAARDLRRGELGLPAMYTTGLVFLLISGMPLRAGLFATLTQIWPNLANDKLVRSQRRLFAEQRRRPAWVRLQRANGGETEVHIDEVQREDLVLLRRGETVPVDGVVVEGLASVVDAPALGSCIRDVTHGDTVLTGGVLRDGSLTVRVERAGSATLASTLDAWLPHAGIQDMPSALEVERIGNRNAKPALLASAAGLVLTRTLRLSQALIRPDYVSAPRLAVQLSGLKAIAEGLQAGVVFKRPAAIDRLAQAELFVIDDSIDLARPRLSVAAIETNQGVSQEQLLQYAFSARQHSGREQSQALAAAAEAANVKALNTPVARFAGLSRYRAADGHTIEVATEPYLRASRVHVPKRLAQLHDGAERPLWVLRNGDIIGKITFARRGAALGLQLVAALKAHAPRAQVLYLASGHDADVQALAASVGIDAAYAGLTQAQKAKLIRDTPRPSVWIGDGTSVAARESLQASAASVSLTWASAATTTGQHDLLEDAADVLLGAGDSEQVATALGLAREHAVRLAADYRTVYSVNLLGVAGAIALRFTSLQAGLLSHAGTWLVYARHARALDRLASQAEATRQRLAYALHP